MDPAGLIHWKYTASDIADWFDAQTDKHWQQHDDWLVDTQLHGETHTVFVLASWLTDRINTLPQRAQSLAASTVMDVLRLGNDFEFDSGWGIAKGAFLNLMRVLVVFDPAASALGISRRQAGMVATSQLKRIPGATGQCQFVAVNNLLSYLRGRPVQIFASVEDIVGVMGHPAPGGVSAWGVPGFLNEMKLAFSKVGVEFRPVAGMRSVEEVLRYAATTDEPVSFAIRWTKANGEPGSHALVAVKDALGSVKLLDYVPAGGTGTFRGYSSLAEMLAERPQWGRGLLTPELYGSTVFAFSTRFVKFLAIAERTFVPAVAISMGVKWFRSASPDALPFEIARSAWRFLKARLGDKAPTPPRPSVVAPVATVPPTVTAQPAPDLKGRRLGVGPLPPDAALAPRLDWLTGVQYRLKYLNYYKGPVSGQNDGATKGAVLAFQKDWFTDAKEWDAVPGPVTQAMLYSVVGW